MRSCLDYAIEIVNFFFLFQKYNLYLLYYSIFRTLPAAKRKKIEESPDDIPEVLQGEIARLDQRFKVI